MDTAYDRIQEETLPAETQEAAPGAAPAPNLNSEIQEAFRAVSASPWGASLGSFFGQVRRQGESLYHDIQKEASEASKEASKGLTSLRDTVVAAATSSASNITTEKGAEPEEPAAEGERPVSPTADIVREASSLVASLRSTATARLKDLQKAEDAADDALLKFGLNVREFLRDTIKITAPGETDGSEVLFEATDSSGKKVFHSTRLEAQLHAIHASSAKFTRDPSGEAWRAWESSFDIAAQKPRIAEDLARHEELRRAYEWAVPERADYKNFWMRYYFLRQAVDEEERRRKEVLKGAAGETEEEVGWDDDDEDAEDERQKPSEEKAALGSGHKASESTTTLSGGPTIADSDLLKPSDSRRSEDEQRSVADSDASYDMMTASGATSRVTGSPQLEPTKNVPVTTSGSKDDEDEEDDWE